MKEINIELNVAIANHKSLSILKPLVEGIISDAKDFEWSFPLSDKYLRRKAEAGKKMLNVTYSKRKELKTTDEVFEALKKLISELGHSPISVNT